MNAGTGKMLWQTIYPCKYTPTDVTAGFGPKSTPTVDGDRVYMLGVAGVFHCFEAAAGKVLWKHDLRRRVLGRGQGPVGRRRLFHLLRGRRLAARIPARRREHEKKDGGCVLLPVGGKKAGAMTAFDRRDGKVVWKSPLTDRSSYASPMFATLAGVRQIVGFTGLRMVGLRPDDGSLLWDHPFPADYEQTIITPVIWKDRVIVAGERKPTIALEVVKADGKLTTKTAWSNPQLRCYVSSPVMFKDHLVGLNSRNQLVCVDLSTGKTAWAGGNFGDLRHARRGRRRDARAEPRRRTARPRGEHEEIRPQRSTGSCRSSLRSGRTWPSSAAGCT